MKSSILKLTAISIVIAIGVLIVLQAKQTGKKGQTEEQADDQLAQGSQLGDEDDDPIETAASTGENGKNSVDADEEYQSEFVNDDDEVVPASAKLSRTNIGSNRRPAPPAQRKSHGGALADDDESGANPESDSPNDDRETTEIVDSSHRHNNRESGRSTARLRSFSDRDGDDLDSSASDEEENPNPKPHRSNPQRNTPKTSGRKPLIIPDDDEETEVDTKSKSVRPVANEEATDTETETDGESVAADLADADEEFRPSNRPNSNSSLSTKSSRDSVRERFAKDETDDPDESESVGVRSTEQDAEEEMNEEDDAIGSSGIKSSSAKDTVGEDDLPVGSASGRKSGILEDDEDRPRRNGSSQANKESPQGGTREVDSNEQSDDIPLSSSRRSPSTNARSLPARSDSARTSNREEDEEVLPVRRPAAVVRSPNEATGRKAPATRTSVDDDDPLSIKQDRDRSSASDANRSETNRDEPLTTSRRGAETDEIAEPVQQRPRPRLVIEKNAPDTAVIGKVMQYEIVVENKGLVAARGVTVEDVIPTGIRVDGSKPQGQLDGRRMSWRLGTMEPGTSQTIVVRVTPQSEGTISGVATVHFESDKPNTPKNGPRLQVNIDAPKRVVVGQSVQMNFKVRNVGTSDATRVLIHDVLPAALRHPQGDDLEYEVGDIPAGSSKEIQLKLTAAQAGQAINRAVVTADGAVSEESVVSLEVVGPQINITRTGPKKLNPGKKGRFTNTVVNPTTTLLTNTTLVETIPASFEFLDATDGGQYDPQRRTVTWQLGSLESRESRTVSISVSAQGRGSIVSVVRATDPTGASGEAVGTTQVVGMPALSVEVPDLPGALDVGQEVTASVRIYNRGSDTATNSRVTVTLPATMEVVSIDAPVKYQRVATVGGRPRTEIRFDPLRSIDVKKFAELRLTLRARSAGAGRMLVQAGCDQITDPIRREDDLSVVAE